MTRVPGPVSRRDPLKAISADGRGENQIMQAISYQVSTLLFRSYATLKSDPDLELCFYFSMLGLVLSLAVLRVFGSASFLLLGAMG